MVKKETQNRFYSPNITVRVSRPTKDKLVASAKSHDRSYRQEIEARIQASFEAEDLAATFLDDKSLLSMLAVFSRYYGRILKTAQIQRGTKLAIGLAGETFKHTALSFVEGSLPVGLGDNYDEETQKDNDVLISKEAIEALSNILLSQNSKNRLSADNLAIEVVKKSLDSISEGNGPAPVTLNKVYRAINGIRDAEDAFQAKNNIKDQMAWLNNAILQNTMHSDKLSDDKSE